MISCLLAGMGKNSHKQVYDKIKEVTQDSLENPTLFLNRLTEAMTKDTN
jgi:aspartate/glutamate racemase